MKLLPRPLTAAAFAPFGDVIQAEGADSFLINDGLARRYHDLAAVDTEQQGGRPGISLFHAVPAMLPLHITTLERHLLGSQAFMPLHTRPFLVVVAPTNHAARGGPGKPLAFITNGSQGINFRRGTWHHSLLALHEPGDFLVIDRIGHSVDCETAQVAGEWVVAEIGGR